ncbi:MAG: formyltransferase, partial [Burkholderiales bacterium]
FSFYYRNMLKAPLLAAAQRGALNMHGSLLPKYRGRAPVNWAVINGERETGATLHYMVEKPDAGDIVDQQAVPILPDDTAYDVFNKVTVAAEMVLDRSLPGLIDGIAQRRPQQLAQGSYFGGRTPEDGRIDWRRPARVVHNLIRGVAPPYPGAFTEIRGCRLRVLRSLLVAESGETVQPQLYTEGDGCLVRCGGGGIVRLLELDLDGEPVNASQIERVVGALPIPL